MDSKRAPLPEEQQDDPLGPLPSFGRPNAPRSHVVDANNNNNNNNNNSSPQHTHMHTYTAGEDGSRLQQAAKELGLQQARQPRQQVRNMKKKSTASRFSFPAASAALQHLILDTSMEDARMRAIYSSHADIDNISGGGDGALFRTSLPDYLLQTVLEQQGDKQGATEIGMDAHGHEIGGDLFSACTGIIKGMVGPAILYLPHGFASAGYIVALPIMCVCTTLFLYSSSCLLDAWKLESTRSSQESTALLVPGRGGPGRQRQQQQQQHRPRPMLSYPELAYRALGVRGESLVKAGIALMQSGVCLTYLIFVPQNLHSSVLILTGVDIPLQYWLIVMVACQVPLSWIRDIRKLTPTNALANGLILYGLITCLGFALQEATTPDEKDVNLATQDGPLGEIGHHLAALAPFEKDWFLFIGTSVLLFEGSITLLVPLQEAVQKEEERKAFPTVYRRVILGIICFYAFFGITCWMAFGNNVKTVLTTSLPETALATTVQLAYSVAVIFTFPLQNFPALEIACRTISAVLSPGKKPGSTFYTRRNVISSVLVMLLAVVAVCTMDSLDKVVSLMGSLLGCPIAFVFPPMIHSQLDPNLTPTRKWANRVTATLGIIAMVLASTTTLLTWN